MTKTMLRPIFQSKSLRKSNHYSMRLGSYHSKFQSFRLHRIKRRHVLPQFTDCFRTGQNAKLLGNSQGKMWGAALTVTGTVWLTPKAKQPLEVHAEKIRVEASSAPDYPLQKKRHTLEYLRTIQHFRPRTNTLSAIFRLRSYVALAIHKFFHDNGFYYIHTPIITGSDCGGERCSRFHPGR